MSHVTTCTTCGALYEETSEEAANAPERECMACHRRDFDGDCETLGESWSRRYNEPNDDVEES